jgi:hypothetical protein
MIRNKKKEKRKKRKLKIKKERDRKRNPPHKTHFNKGKIHRLLADGYFTQFDITFSNQNP